MGMKRHVPFGNASGPAPPGGSGSLPNGTRDERRPKACLAAGMDGHLSQPFTKHQLTEILDHWLPHASPILPTVAPDGGPDTPVPDAHVIDDTALDELRALDRDGSNNGLRTVVTLYLDKSPRSMAQLAQGWNDSNHKLTGRRTEKCGKG